jgi:hypothetical protein
VLWRVGRHDLARVQPRGHSGAGEVPPPAALVRMRAPRDPARLRFVTLFPSAAQFTCDAHSLSLAQVTASAESPAHVATGFEAVHLLLAAPHFEPAAMQRVAAPASLLGAYDLCADICVHRLLNSSRTK